MEQHKDHTPRRKDTMLAVWVGVGVALGAALNNFALGLGIGMVIWVIQELCSKLINKKQ
ncbi:MAG TPA: hypothetical protein VFA41_22065 [Ktedonobacteraceae bacterium]|jgi:hypothetical protein|nr:hypothetical protein [Ktedonobacteraceae bacterium]